MYHLHERLSCLYAETGVHSTKVGEGLDKKPLYGKWDDKSTDTLPELDACGGQFGYTPESPSKMVYHYHVQAGPPYTFGCYGPDKDTNGDEILVTLEKCRSLYAGCGDTTKRITVTTAAGSQEYGECAAEYTAILLLLSLSLSLSLRLSHPSFPSSLSLSLSLSRCIFFEQTRTAHAMTLTGATS
jgi:hypothetical protein